MLNQPEIASIYEKPKKIQPKIYDEKENLKNFSPRLNKTVFIIPL